jgi:tetratricopeptide (TPR) repeat protein
MTRVFRKSRIAVLLLLVGLANAIPALAELLGAEEVLRRLEKSITGAQLQSPSKPAQLLADIQRFRVESGAMDARKAAGAWLELYDRAASLGQLRFEGDYRVYDTETTNVVGLQSVLAALPGPGSWRALRDDANARVRQAPGDARALALRLVTELLAGDRSAGAATLAEIERVAAKLPPKEREAMRAQVAYMQAELARLYGSPEDIAATFVASLDVQSRRAFGAVPVPDLVGLVGETKAGAILGEAVSKPVRLHVPEGDRTRALARRVALEKVASLRLPQWGLVDSMEGADLYEALERRFVGVAGKEAREPGAQVTVPGERYASHKGDADVYYFLHLVVQGRHADAERALRAAAGENPLQLPKRAVDALERAGYNEALFRFLHALLERRPELRAWEVYTKQAAYTGHSAEALALVDKLLSRRDLPDYVLADLRFHRVNALLAADKVEPAVAALRELLAAPPKPGERTLQARTDAAVRLAGLGRVLERGDLAKTGLGFARAVLALPADRERNWQRERLLKEVFAEQRKLGSLEQAQEMAIAELQRSSGTPNEEEQYGLGVPSNERAAIIELAGLYGASQRHKDVIVLLDKSPKWGARDLGPLLAEKDSLGVPVALTAARALAETGNSAAALALARALIDALPGYDPAYELLAGLDKDAHVYLSKVYLRDRFEERPLIWMAIVLHRKGRDLEAESLIRQAIVIDPSDGDEGPSDRMRAYAVLADILETKGDKASAAGFRKAVQAIRISERSDELHRLGLYERAFAGYREALGHFSDAYCIQSRLAVRLNEQGRRQEAAEHYRRAYELMPASFGRVESHCFGCESVFQGPAQQKIAETVFTDLLAKDPKKPQLHYLLGYLQKERGLYADALKRFRESVILDPEYLNAWKHLHELGSHVYIESRERDIARLKLLQLDPRQSHVSYDLESVGDLAELWRAVESANAASKPAGDAGFLYPLRQSAAAQDEARAKLPEPMRAQMEQYQQYQAMMNSTQNTQSLPTPRQALARHKLMKASAQLMGVKEFGQELE